MKRMLVLCINTTCTAILWSMEWDLENPEFTLIETTGAIDHHEACEKCRNQPKPKPIPIKPVRFGEENTDDFQKMMAKRKLEDRKKSGKGPPRGGGR